MQKVSECRIGFEFERDNGEIINVKKGDELFLRVNNLLTLISGDKEYILTSGESERILQDD